MGAMVGREGEDSSSGMIKEGVLKEAHLNWALKGARSWNEEMKGKGIPGRRNGISNGTAMMELTAGSRSWGGHPSRLEGQR